MCKAKQWFCVGLISVLVIMVLTGWDKSVQSQEKYPSRSIDLIVPFIPGGATDVYGRIVAAFLNKKWGVSMNVINKGGGNSVPANLEVYQATPDGYTLMVDCGSSCSFLEVAIKNLPFKVLDRTLIGMIGASQHAFAVPGTSSWKNLKDLEAEVKKDPEHFTWTSLGGAATMDFTTRQFLKAINVDVSKTKPIICRGGGEANALVGGGHVKLAIGTATSSYPAVKAGVARCVAVTYSRVPELYPDLPTAAEQGYPTIDAVYWMGFSGPPKLPSHIIDIWNKALQEISNDPEFLSKLKNAGGFPFYRNSIEAREHVKKEMGEAEKLWGLK